MTASAAALSSMDDNPHQAASNPDERMTRDSPPGDNHPVAAQPRPGGKVRFPAAYPTAEHESAANAIVAFFAARGEVDAILLTNSCARGKATRDSCLDVVVLLAERSPAASLDREWQRAYECDPTFAALREVGAFSVVHLDFSDGRFAPDPHPDDEYPDDFEVMIGNYLVYAVPLWQRGDRLARLRRQWLPYYGEAMRRERLAGLTCCCRHDLEHIPLSVARGLYFQAFDRLYRAFRIFLQALFVSRRTYPIAYNKWIHEQIVEILALPELYARLPHLFELQQFESPILIDKAADLRGLLDRYVVEEIGEGGRDHAASGIGQCG